MVNNEGSRVFISQQEPIGLWAPGPGTKGLIFAPWKCDALKTICLSENQISKEQLSVDRS